MGANKWMKQLQQMDGAVDKTYNPFAEGNVLQTKSPSLNWVFGKGAGLPFGYSAVLFGPPKSGKSLLSNLFIGNLHQTDKEAVAIKFNTEMREEGQTSEYWGIDQDRYMAFNVNTPELVFDRIAGEITQMVQDGMPLKLIIIDSLQGMQGMREAAADSITNHQIGDHALMLQKGLKRILPLIRQHRIAFICTAHIRANLDAGMYGPKEKMAGSWATKHFFEYFIEVKRDGSKEGKTDELGNALEDDSVKDFRGNKERVGHKIYVRMDDSSVGVAGRSGEFTLSYKEGLINTHEEVFLLAKNLGLVEQPNNRTYVFGGTKYNSKQEFLTALKDNESISKQIIDLAYSRDRV
jgi:RecA/RadA recombinase